LPRASNSLYISATIDFQIAISFLIRIIYYFSFCTGICPNIEWWPSFNLHIKSYAPTTVLFLHTQGYVPYGSVIPTWIAMPHSAVLSLHIKSYYPYCSIILAHRVVTYSYTPNSFRGQESKKSANQKQESPVAAMFVNGKGRNELSL
jgi:hypothetical protein